MKGNFHVRFGERGGETRRLQSRKVRPAPTLRSAHFLVEATEFLALALATDPYVPSAAPAEEDLAHWRRRVVERCIYGVDRNPLAVELAKLSLWLATVAAVSPFIGLFGTVWGIIDSFQALGLAGSASLRAVAPGISEALVATALGLGAAIPAAIFYNYFGHVIKEIGARMEDFSMEFMNVAERTLEG